MPFAAHRPLFRTISVFFFGQVAFESLWLCGVCERDMAFMWIAGTAARDLGVTMTSLAKRLSLSVAAITRSVKWGQGLKRKSLFTVHENANVKNVPYSPVPSWPVSWIPPFERGFLSPLNTNRVESKTVRVRWRWWKHSRSFKRWRPDLWLTVSCLFSMVTAHGTGFKHSWWARGGNGHA